MKRVVISSTHKRLVILLLEAAGIVNLIDDIVSGDEIRNGKPHSEPFLLGMNKAKTSTSTTIAIGDSLHHLNCPYNILNAEINQSQTIRRDDVATTPFR